LLVLAVSLGASAVFAVLDLIRRIAAPVPLADQSADLNTATVTLPWLDFVYQLTSNAFRFAVPLLAIYLLAGGQRGWLKRGGRMIGLTPNRPWRDLGWGALLAGGIGLPGIGLYLLGRELGLTVHVSTASLGSYWWTVPILVLAAVRNALVEEVIVVAYLADRLTRLGWRGASWIALSALLRGSYHLYQGYGPFVGNVVMGLVFGWVYFKWRRAMPLVVAHTLMDVVAFVGPALLSPAWLT
jgi:membrane protease YdiL (CAAX protease family)